MTERQKGHWALVVSAGTGARMGGNLSKGLLKIDDIPIIAFSLHALQHHEAIDSICLVAHQLWMHEYEKIIDEYHITKIDAVIPGGVSRQESVFRGLSETKEFARRVFIHDGARPFLDPDSISQSLKLLYEFPGVSVGSPITDTVKRCDESDLVKEEVSRVGLMAVQTPQAFRFRDIFNAHLEARKRGWRATDDTSLMTRMGLPVKIIEGSQDNIKITHPGDLYLAELILRKLRKAGKVKI